MRHARNFLIRLSINYLALTSLLLLAGVSIEDRRLFGVWGAALVFTALSVTIRRVLLALTLPLIIMSAGLFVFVIDGFILMLTGAISGLEVYTFWWALLGVVVMSIVTIWVEKAFRGLGWLRDEDDPGGDLGDFVARRPTSLKATLLGFVLLLALGFSAAMAWQVFLAVGMVVRRIAVMVAVAGVAFYLLSFAIAWLGALGLALHRRGLFSILVALVATLVVVVPAGSVILLASPLPAATERVVRPGTAYWALPTGSRIAYTLVPAQGIVGDRNPVIYLHGGLGRAVLDSDIAFFGRLAAAGYDVYLYDQVGTGLSGRLPRIASYTVGRHVADLEAIRETIEADRLILIAHAEGGEIALRYLIEHRDRVERLVFYSPTALWNDERFIDDLGRTAASGRPWPTLNEIRPLVARALALRSPRTAERYVSQAEMTAWSDLRADHRAMVCAGAGALAPKAESPGYNAYATVVGNLSTDTPPDPRPELQRVVVPAILLRGACDPVDWDVVIQYREAIPGLTIYYVEETGSMLHLGAPQRTYELLRDFLTDGAMPIEPLYRTQLRTGGRSR